MFDPYSSILTTMCIFYHLPIAMFPIIRKSKWKLWGIVNFFLHNVESNLFCKIFVFSIVFFCDQLSWKPLQRRQHCTKTQLEHLGQCCWMRKALGSWKSPVKNHRHYFRQSQWSWDLQTTFDSYTTSPSQLSRKF